MAEAVEVIEVRPKLRNGNFETQSAQDGRCCIDVCGVW